MTITLTTQELLEHEKAVEKWLYRRDEAMRQILAHTFTNGDAIERVMIKIKEHEEPPSLFSL